MKASNPSNDPVKTRGVETVEV